MKKFLYTLLGIGIALAGTVFAVQISVPSAPRAGYMLTSSSTGQYVATSTYPLYVGGINATSSSLVSQFNGGLLILASSTLQKFTGTNSTTTNATTTNFYVSGNASTSSLFLGTGTGCLSVTNGLVGASGSACGSGGGGNSKWATSTDNVSIFPNSAIKVGIGTSTPFSTLSVSTTSGNLLNLPMFTVASSSHAVYFQITGNGQSLFQTGSVATPAITFVGDTNTGISTPSADNLAFSLKGVENFRSILGGYTLFGTTTASLSTLTVASSTAPQIHFSDGVVGDGGWAIRNAGGVFYLSSTTAAMATSSLFSLQINPTGAASLSVGSTTQTVSAVTGLITQGSNGANGSSTIAAGKWQVDLYNSAGTRSCMFVAGTSVVVVAGACTP